jgi:hypothetical protein
VTDASDGEPIEGARVLVWSYSPFELLGTAHTDEHGFYTFYLSGDYGAGDYLFSARAHGYRNSIGFASRRGMARRRSISAGPSSLRTCSPQAR